MLLHTAGSSCTRALGVLALISAFQVCGIPTLVSSVSAQPIVPQAKKLKPLKSVDMARMDYLAALAEQENLCNTPVDLTAHGATIQEIADKLKVALPRLAPVEVRQASAARFSIDLQKTKAGQILESVASLAGARLYLFADRLLITQEAQLSADERQNAIDWLHSSGSNGSSMRARFKARVALTEGIVAGLDDLTTQVTRNAPAGVTGSNSQQFRMGQLDPELQQLIERLVNLPRSGSKSGPTHITPDAIITTRRNGQHEFHLNIKLSSQQVEYMYSHTHQNITP
jgi:hypothetical protein